MQNFISLITLNVNTIIERNRALYEKRLNLVTESYKVENEGLSPNIDKKGRLHAPCNGYKIPDRQLSLCDFTACYDEKLFRKGEFLPNPITDDQFFFFSGASYDKSFKTSFCLEESDEMMTAFKTLQEESNDLPFDISFSRSWTFNKKTYCHVNVKSGWKSIISLFEEQMSIITEEKEAIEKARKAIEAAERKALKGVAPTGRKKVKGTVTNIKMYEGYAYNTVTYKMLVTLENGATVFGSIPSSIIDVEKGETVEFTATFEENEEDNTHSFYKRPSKAIIVKESVEA